MRWYTGCTPISQLFLLSLPFYRLGVPLRPVHSSHESDKARWPLLPREHRVSLQPVQPSWTASVFQYFVLFPKRSCLNSSASVSRISRLISSPAAFLTGRLVFASGSVTTVALRTAVTHYSSFSFTGGCGEPLCTHVSPGSGNLRLSKKNTWCTTAAEEMDPGVDTPKHPRRGRPPGSKNKVSTGVPIKSARKTSSTTVKHTAGHTKPLGRLRGSAAFSAAAVGAAVAVASTKPTSSGEEHPPAQTVKVTSENGNGGGGGAVRDAGACGGQYELSSEALCAQTSARLGYPLHAVRYVLTQVKDGATVPFLARYRQGETGRMDETQLRRVLDTAKEVKEVHRRRQFMLHSLESRGLLTPALQAALESMVHVSQLEDTWEPYKERRTSLASRGRAEGLDKYAFTLLHYNPEKEECRQLLKELRAAVRRVEDGERLLIAIVAEDIQRNEGVRRLLGEYCRRTTRLTCTMVNKPRKKVAKDMLEENFEQLKKHFAFYDGKAWSVERIAAHVVLALQRGEAKGVLLVETTFGPKSHGLFMHSVREEFPDVAHLLPPPNERAAAAGGSGNTHHSDEGNSAFSSVNTIRDVVYCRHLLLSGMEGAYDYLIKQLSTAVRRDLKKSAEQEAIAVFAHNLHHMLLQRPLSHSRILAMDPGHTHGVKCVVLDEHGAVETFFTCALMDEAKMRQYVTQVVEAHRVNKIVIGNGTASGETAELVADLIKKRKWGDVEFAVVSEAGASVYSVSDIAKEEFPSLSVMYRGAVSIGRRVLDPLSELVKIPVRSMGIGMYQHDVNEKELMKELSYVLESCVAKVGINAVSANRYVMEKVPGIQKKIVDQIVLARHAKKLHSREDLRRVPAMTENVYEQIAGFFRFPNSPEPLDNTNIHPESYPLVRRLVQLYAAGALTPAEATTSASGGAILASNTATIAADIGDSQTRQDVARALRRLPPAQLAALAAQRLNCTVETLEMITEELLYPGLDPRASLPHAGLLRREVRDVRDLRSGDVLSGVVQSVTMFGAFVDCGLHDSVLVRGDGVDTLQVGAYLNKRIRFDTLDHLKRPRMFLLPDPSEGTGGGHTAAGAVAGSRRLRLESEDTLRSDRRDVGQGGVSGDDIVLRTASNDIVASMAPRSLSATILRERKRRAEAENGSSKRSMATINTGVTAAGQDSSAPEAPFETLNTSADAPQQFTRQKTPLPAAETEQRGQKRRRLPSPETPRTQPHLNVQQALPSTQPTVKNAVLPVEPPMVLSKGRAAPLNTFVTNGAFSSTSSSHASLVTNAANVMTASVKEHSTFASETKAAKPVTTHAEEVDVNTQSVDGQSSSSGSNFVFSF